MSRYVIPAKAGITQLLSAAGAAVEKKPSLQLKKPLHPDVILADAGIQAALDLYFCFRKSGMMLQKEEMLSLKKK